MDVFFTFVFCFLRDRGKCMTTERAVDILLSEDHRKRSDKLIRVQTFDPMVHHFA